MQELNQENGKDWRRFTLREDGIQVEQSSSGFSQSKRYYYKELGPLTEDYEYTKVRQNRRQSLPVLALRVITIALSLVALGCFEASGILAGAPLTVTSLASVAFGWVLLLIVIFSLSYLFKKVPVKVLFFTDRTLIRLYSRNEKDDDQIKSFSESYETHRLAWLKKEFIKAVEENPENLSHWLNHLNEKEQFTEKEYRIYLRKIQKAKKTHQKPTRTQD